MKRVAIVAAAITLAVAAVAISGDPRPLVIAQAPPAPATPEAPAAQPAGAPAPQDNPGFYEGEAGLTPYGHRLTAGFRVSVVGFRHRVGRS